MPTLDESIKRMKQEIIEDITSKPGERHLIALHFSALHDCGAPIGPCQPSMEDCYENSQM